MIGQLVSLLVFGLAKTSRHLDALIQNITGEEVNQS